jgi:tetratricopeptide (TPR) repeat protein
MGEAIGKGTRSAKLEEMVEQNPDAPFPRYALALEYRSAGLSDEALELFEGLIRRQPEYVPAYLQFALLLQECGDDDRMVEILNQGIAAAARQGDRKAVEELSALLEE